uniref:Uncharacterized protein n=1 Tax=Oryza barthii TaxID=65489 RepID=A0A0D3H0Z2_9ORYZ
MSIPFSLLSLLLLVFFFLPLHREPREGRREGERGAGAPVVDRLRRRRQNMFPSDAHPGRVLARWRGRWPEQRRQELNSGDKRRWWWRFISRWRERGKGKNGITSSRRSQWREDLVSGALVREIGRWRQ